MPKICSTIVHKFIYLFLCLALIFNLPTPIILADAPTSTVLPYQFDVSGMTVKINNITIEQTGYTPDNTSSYIIPNELLKLTYKFELSNFSNIPVTTSTLDLTFAFPDEIIPSDALITNPSAADFTVTSTIVDSTGASTTTTLDSIGTIAFSSTGASLTLDRSSLIDKGPIDCYLVITGTYDKTKATDQLTHDVTFQINNETITLPFNFETATSLTPPTLTKTGKLDPLTNRIAWQIDIARLGDWTLADTLLVDKWADRKSVV